MTTKSQNTTPIVEALFAAYCCKYVLQVTQCSCWLLLTAAAAASSNDSVSDVAVLVLTVTANDLTQPAASFC
eukprot:9937-Heterococcus_DN1.PRE.2